MPVADVAHVGDGSFQTTARPWSCSSAWPCSTFRSLSSSVSGLAVSRHVPLTPPALRAALHLTKQPWARTYLIITLTIVQAAVFWVLTAVVGFTFPCVVRLTR